MSESEKERPTIKDNPTAWFEIDTNVMVFVTLMFVIMLYIYAIYSYKTQKTYKAEISEQIKTLNSQNLDFSKAISDLWMGLAKNGLISPKITNFLTEKNN